MLIALSEASLCLGSVVCGLICCKVIVIYGGGTLSILFLCCSRGAQRNTNNMCSDPCKDQDTFRYAFLYIFASLYICRSLFICCIVVFAIGNRILNRVAGFMITLSCLSSSTPWYHDAVSTRSGLQHQNSSKRSNEISNLLKCVCEDE